MSTGKEPSDTTDSEEMDGNQLRQALFHDPKLKRLAVTHHFSARQPEKMSYEEEQRMEVWKRRIMDAYLNYHHGQRNVTKEETQAIKTLKEREVIVKCSDKSKSMVVLSKEEYERKVVTILSNKENYEESTVTAENLEKLLATELKKMKGLKQTLPPDMYRGLFQQDSRLPEFYGLPKIHKAEAPLRPVVAAFDGPMSKVSILLERILHQLLKFVPGHIGSTQEAIESLRRTFPDLKVPRHTILVTMDVVALYPSIPIDDGIQAVLELLVEHEEEVDLLGLSVPEVGHLLTLILNNNYFRFGQKVYRQCNGVAMGNHLAPPLAIVFMGKLEKRMLETAQKRPEFYDRYVDDCLMAWLHGEEELEVFFRHCNDQHPNIHFTWETSKDSSQINFMDLTARIQDQQLEYELFMKPSNSGVNLNFTSAIPRYVKTAVATEQFHRAVALSSNEEMEERSCGKISALLQGNSYPTETIERLCNTSQRWKKGKAKSARGQLAQGTSMLRLPFRSDELHRKIARICRESELPIRLVYRQNGSLKNRLVRSAWSKPSCSVHQKYVEQENRIKRSRGKPRDDCLACLSGLEEHQCGVKGTVYLLKCKLCDEEYIGESARTIRARLGEHHFQARNACKESPWGEHAKKHPEITISKQPIFVARILAICANNITRKVRESIEIRDRSPKINRSRGWKN